MTVPDLFTQMNNAVLDIQAADLQSIEHPMRKLARLLTHQDLAAIRAELTSELDLEAFLQKGEHSGGSMIGSKRLPWPDDTRTELGLKLLLLDKLGGDSDFAINFGHEYYHSGNKLIAGLHAMNRQLIIPFLRDFKAYVLAQGATEPKLLLPLSNRVFIVTAMTAKRARRSQGFSPISASSR